MITINWTFYVKLNLILFNYKFDAVEALFIRKGIILYIWIVIK